MDPVMQDRIFWMSSKVITLAITKVRAKDNLPQAYRNSKMQKTNKAEVEPAPRISGVSFDGSDEVSVRRLDTDLFKIFPNPVKMMLGESAVHCSTEQHVLSSHIAFAL